MIQFQQAFAAKFAESDEREAEMKKRDEAMKEAGRMEARAEQAKKLLDIDLLDDQYPLLSIGGRVDEINGRSSDRFSTLIPATMRRFKVLDNAAVQPIKNDTVGPLNEMLLDHPPLFLQNFQPSCRNILGLNCVDRQSQVGH